MRTRNSLIIGMSAIGMLAAIGFAQANEADNSVQASFTKSYAYRTYLKDDSIKITSKDGVVTLSGEVANQYHKSMAQDIAEAQPGVKSVDNRLVVSGEQPTEGSDLWVSAKVKMALAYYSNVNAIGTDVDVKDGVVTLHGEADSAAQKELTTEVAKDIDGVKDVKNDMTIAGKPAKKDATTAEAIDDASITAQIKGALLTHRSTSALKTKVTTNEGVVTISGPAKNAAEKDLVTRLAQNVSGTKKVINNMTVNP